MDSSLQRPKSTELKVPIFCFMELVLRNDLWPTINSKFGRFGAVRNFHCSIIKSYVQQTLWTETNDEQLIHSSGLYDKKFHRLNLSNWFSRRYCLAYFLFSFKNVQQFRSTSTLILYNPSNFSILDHFCSIFSAFIPISKFTINSYGVFTSNE